MGVFNNMTNSIHYNRMFYVAKSDIPVFMEDISKINNYFRNNLRINDVLNVTTINETNKYITNDDGFTNSIFNIRVDGKYPSINVKGFDILKTPMFVDDQILSTNLKNMSKKMKDNEIISFINTCIKNSSNNSMIKERIVKFFNDLVDIDNYEKLFDENKLSGSLDFNKMAYTAYKEGYVDYLAKELKDLILEKELSTKVKEHLEKNTNYTGKGNKVALFRKMLENEKERNIFFDNILKELLYFEYDKYINDIKEDKLSNRSYLIDILSNAIISSYNDKINKVIIPIKDKDINDIRSYFNKKVSYLSDEKMNSSEYKKYINNLLNGDIYLLGAKNVGDDSPLKIYSNVGGKDKIIEIPSEVYNNINDNRCCICNLPLWGDNNGDGKARMYFNIVYNPTNKIYGCVGSECIEHLMDKTPLYYQAARDENGDIKDHAAGTSFLSKSYNLLTCVQFMSAKWPNNNLLEIINKNLPHSELSDTQKKLLKEVNELSKDKNRLPYQSEKGTDVNFDTNIMDNILGGLNILDVLKILTHLYLKDGKIDNDTINKLYMYNELNMNEDKTNIMFNMSKERNNILKINDNKYNTIINGYKYFYSNKHSKINLLMNSEKNNELKNSINDIINKYNIFKYNNNSVVFKLINLNDYYDWYKNILNDYHEMLTSSFSDEMLNDINDLLSKYGNKNINIKNIKISPEKFDISKILNTIDFALKHTDDDNIKEFDDVSLESSNIILSNEEKIDDRITPDRYNKYRKYKGMFLNNVIKKLEILVNDANSRIKILCKNVVISFNKYVEVMIKINDILKNDNFVNETINNDDNNDDINTERLTKNDSNLNHLIDNEG